MEDTYSSPNDIGENEADTTKSEIDDFEARLNNKLPHTSNFPAKNFSPPQKPSVGTTNNNKTKERVVPVSSANTSKKSATSKSDQEREQEEELAADKQAVKDLDNFEANLR